MRDKDKEAKLPEKLREVTVNPRGASIANSLQGRGEKGEEEGGQRQGRVGGAHKVARHFDERHAVVAVCRPKAKEDARREQ